MHIDEPRLHDLIVESEDMQADALRSVPSSLDDMRDLRADRRGTEISPETLSTFQASRRRLLKGLGLTAGGVATGGFASVLTGILARPVAAAPIDVMILQTASSLERLAVNTYGAALTLPFIADGNPVVKKFAMTTMGQHDQHRQAFQAQTQALGGKVQDTPNPKYAPIVEQMKPSLTTPAAVVKLAMTLEQVARDTYLADLAMFEDVKSKTVMASVMGVETQHLATLRAVAALLAANAPALIAIPVDASKLPAAAGSVGFPMAIPQPELASPPQEGAIS